MDTNLLVIGLGSMGKRRVRNLIALGFKNIYGFDLRDDRRNEAQILYNINVVETFEEAKNKGCKAWIISTSPDTHHIYMKEAVDSKVPAFIEASVVDTDFEMLIADSLKNNVLLAPSSTLFFHPAIKLINQIIKSNQIGNVTNILYHSGQYLPDWHTYEKVEDFYVSKQETGGAREIVPFELTWLTKIFGFPNRVCGFYKKTINIPGAEKIEDTYNILLEYDKSILNLSVDVVSRHATRKLLVNGELGQIQWDWDEKVVKLYNADKGTWIKLDYDTSPAQQGYNKNITEQMYIDEINCFLNAAFNNDVFENSLVEDYKVLKLLYAAEISAQTNQIQKN